MKIKTNESYEVKLYIGSCEGYNGQSFTEGEMIAVIGNYQKNSDATPVRLTPTAYIHCDYREKGWEVAAIMYPRYPKSIERINAFMEGLAKHLLVYFKQNRISVIFPDKITMFESDNAEQDNHAKNS